MDLLIEVLKTNGVIAVIAVYMIFQSRKDYKGVCERLNEVEDYVKVKLFNMIRVTTQVIDRNSNIIENCPYNNHGERPERNLFNDDEEQ